MDAATRANRQLMRQRGAGLRNNNNVDFGLDFGSQGSRDDRQLMRQRGAGNRKIGNVDFGFSFPTPSRSRRSSRTPQTSRRSIQRSSKTPTSGRTHHSPTVQSQNNGSLHETEAETQEQDLTNTPQPVVGLQQPNSSRKRRLNPEASSRKPASVIVNVPAVSQSDVPYLSSPKIFGNDLYSRSGDIHGLAIDLDEEYRQRQRQISSPLFFPENDKENEQVHISDLDFPKPTQRSKRQSRSLGGFRNGTVLSRAVSPDNLVVQSIEPSNSVPRRQQIDLTESQSEPIESINTTLVGQSRPDVEPRATSTTDAATNPAKRKRKRKSIVLGPRKRRSLESTRKSSTPVVEPTPIPEAGSSDESLRVDEQSEEERSFREEPEQEESPNESVLLPKKRVTRRRQGRQDRLSVPTSPLRQTLDDEEDDETYIDEEDEENIQEELTTPAENKRKINSRAKIRENRSKDSTSAKCQSKTKQSTFPILTHRITNTEVLPTIMEEDEHEDVSDEDVETLPPALSNRPQPNAVDILAQICRETIQSAVETVGIKPTTSRAETKTKQAALEAFSEALDQRLFDMSEAVEHRLNLEARLRKSKREKAELQARWIEVRRQRDELALQTDTIRRQNWENEEDGKRRWEISELAHSTELELERTEPQDRDDLEFMLMQVGRSVGHSGGQSILNRVKVFNSQLERMAVALER